MRGERLDNPLSKARSLSQYTIGYEDLDGVCGEKKLWASSPAEAVDRVYKAKVGRIVTKASKAGFNYDDILIYVQKPYEMPWEDVDPTTQIEMEF